MILVWLYGTSVVLDGNSCCVWSMIVQRSLFQSNAYPKKFVHPSRVDSPWLGGSGASGPPVGVSRVVPPKLKTDVKFRVKV